MTETILSPNTYALIAQWAMTLAKNLVVAAVVYFVGSRIIKWVARLVVKLLERSKVDPSLYSFLTSMVNVALWLVLAIAIISIFGIETSSFIALFASAGMAIGMALSGTLQNFAGGVMVLLFKPYKVGDYIEAQGYAGTVKAIQIFNTIIRTNDAQTVIIPNGPLSTGTLKNYSTEPYRRVDIDIQLAYGTDVDAAKRAIAEIQRSTPLVVQKPLAEAPAVAEPWTGLKQLADSGVVVATRSWCKGSDYWTVYFNLTETIYRELPRQGFSFPYNRLDVKMVD